MILTISARLLINEMKYKRMDVQRLNTAVKKIRLYLSL